MSRTKSSGDGQPTFAAARSSDPARAGETEPAVDRQDVLQLLMISWAKKAGGPITAEAFLEMVGNELGPFFHAPPLGPIPEYLQAHHFVHQCVAEYEDRLEALERWKVGQICNWLEQSIGTEVVFRDKTYRLQGMQSSLENIARFWFEIIKPSSASTGP